MRRQRERDWLWNDLLIIIVTLTIIVMGTLMLGT